LGKKPTYAVFLNWAKNAEVREGFAKMGADAYFDENSKLLGIYRGATMYLPSGFQGTDKKCTTSWFSRTKCTPAIFGWKQAKMAFRGALSGVVTLIDHLYYLHFCFGNAIISNNIEVLPVGTPVRELLTPAGFRTMSINTLAATALEPEHQMVHRATGLTLNGMKAVYNIAKQSTAIKTFSAFLNPNHTVPVKWTQSGLLPIVEDGRKFRTILSKFVFSYMKNHYDFTAKPDACAADPNLQKWWEAVDDIAFVKQDLGELTCNSITTMMINSMTMVSAIHRHVGNVAAEVMDPCFAPWTFREGEMCGMPSTAGTTAMIMVGTAKPQPEMAGSGQTRFGGGDNSNGGPWAYENLFTDPRDKELWKQMRTELLALDKEVVAKNADKNIRRWPTTVFEAAKIETAISI